MSNTWTKFVPATGEVIGWCSGEQDSPGPDYVLSPPGKPGSVKTHYVKDGELCAYTTDEAQALASLAPGWTWLLPDLRAVDLRTLDVARNHTWTQIKLARDAAEAADFVWDGSAFQADKARISGAVQMALLAQIAVQPFAIDWTLSDNTVRTLSAQDMIAVGVALGQHVAGVFEIGRQLRDQIDAAATNADLAAIGWPL